jgi:hypothetical protein
MGLAYQLLGMQGFPSHHQQRYLKKAMKVYQMATAQIRKSGDEASELVSLAPLAVSSNSKIFTKIINYARSIIWMFFSQENRIFSLVPVSNSGLSVFLLFLFLQENESPFPPLPPDSLHAITMHRQRNKRQGNHNKYLSQVFTATPLPTVGKFFIIRHNHGHHLKYITHKVHRPSKKVRGDGM